MNEKLKPCPFCGGKAKLYGRNVGMYWHMCRKCGASTKQSPTEFDAIIAWNKRANSEKPNLSCSEKANNSKLKFSDLKRMVDLLEWERDDDHFVGQINGVRLFACYKETLKFDWGVCSRMYLYLLNKDGMYESNLYLGRFDSTSSIEGRHFSYELRACAEEFLLRVAAAVLGVERSGE